VAGNVGELRKVLDRPFAQFVAKNLLGSLVTAAAVWLLRLAIPVPARPWEILLYLSLLCGVGSLVFAGSLVTLGALPVTRLLVGWQAPSKERKNG